MRSETLRDLERAEWGTKGANPTVLLFLRGLTQPKFLFLGTPSDFSLAFLNK